MARFRYLFTSVVLAMASLARGEPPTLGEVLDRVDATQAASGRFHVQGQTLSSLKSPFSGQTTFSRVQTDMAVDGDRVDMASSEWKLKDRNAVPLDADADRRREIWDGRTSYFSHRDETRCINSLTISSPKQTPQEGLDRAMHDRALNPNMTLLGVFFGDEVPFASIVRSADPAKCNVREGDWKGTGCVLLEASTRSGLYRVWLNPQRGYRALHATVQKEAGDDFYGGRLDRRMQQPTTPWKRITFEMEVSQFQEIQGTWWPMEGHWTTTVDDADGMQMVDNTRHEFTMVDLAPNLAKLHAFEPTFEDGAKVRIEGEQREGWWVGGKVVDQLGQ